MEPEDVDKLVFKHVNEAFAKLKTKNKLNVSLQHAGKWWVASPNHPNFTAAAKAVERVWNGSSTDAAHSINEKLDKRNYIEGTKLLGAYLHYIAEEPMDTK
jgi:Cys-Gly metallodipeptidase DUG1